MISTQLVQVRLKVFFTIISELLPRYLQTFFFRKNFSKFFEVQISISKSQTGGRYN
jgi:hypothetical protein